MIGRDDKGARMEMRGNEMGMGREERVDIEFLPPSVGEGQDEGI